VREAGRNVGERRRGGVLSSGIRVTGLQTSCLISSALVGAYEVSAGDLDDLEELRDLGAPELVHVARADAVLGCRVAELVRVKYNAKQTRP
jgi:hypothetical protein